MQRFASFTLLLAIPVCLGCGSDSESSNGTNTGGAAGAGTGGSAGSSTGGVSGSGGSTGGTGGGAPCTLGTTWQVVDDFAFAPPEPTFGASLAVDSAGNVYAAGLGKQGTMMGIVRKSENGGTSWANVAWDAASLPNDVAADSAGNVYVISGAGLQARVLRKSADGGDTWTDIDTIPMNTSDPNEPCNTGYVAVGANDVIVTGASCDLSGWIVRKSTNGTTFQDAFGFQGLPGKIARMEAVGVGPGGEAFATGSSQDSVDAPHWTTVTEGSATGTVSDDFQLAAGQSANARSFAVGSGSPMVVGYAADASGTQAYLRRLDGASWTTIDIFDTHGQVVVQVGNQIVVAGNATENGIDRVVTRISTNGGTSFTPIDDYQYVAGKHSRSTGLVSDPKGNVYAAVGAVDADDVNHWIIRKLSCQ